MKEKFSTTVISIVDKISYAIRDTEFENNVYLVGGIVRDAILNIESDDIDIVVDLENGGIDLANLLHKYNIITRKPVVYTRFGTAFSFIDDVKVEFVGARKEIYEEGSRNPIVSTGTILDEVLRRDFTINSLLYDICNDKVLDLTTMGIDDIHNKIIRTPIDPMLTFSQDPLRILRAIRFSSKLDFKIESHCIVGIRNSVQSLSIISKERIREEIVKMLSHSSYNRSLQLLWDTKILEYTFKGITKWNSRFTPIKLKGNDLTYLDVIWYFLQEYYNFQTVSDIVNGLKTTLINLKFSNSETDTICNSLIVVNKLLMYGVDPILIRKLTHVYGKILIGHVLEVFLFGKDYSEDYVQEKISYIVETKMPITGKDICDRWTFSNSCHIGIIYSHMLDMLIANPNLGVDELLNYGYIKKIELEDVAKKGN